MRNSVATLALAIASACAASVNAANAAFYDRGDYYQGASRPVGNTSYPTTQTPGVTRAYGYPISRGSHSRTSPKRFHDRGDYYPGVSRP